jgi:2-desacetyl-2-hydroxyethyl bacteriochlorophyllide A dehydrogenase
MKALVFDKIKSMVLRDIDIPSPKNDQVLLKIKACGICGTDVHIYNGIYDAAYPLIPGHECSGEIVETGPDVHLLKKGDRVAVDPNVECGYCSFCRSGRPHLCKNLKPFGVFRNGGFAEYALIEESHAFLLPDSVSFETGALVEPVSCCMRGSQMAHFKLGDSCLIHGAGAIGMLNMMLARLAGCSVIIVSDPLESRRRQAGTLGSDYTVNPVETDVYAFVRSLLPDGPDVIMECAGRTALVETSVTAVKNGGIVVAFGCCPPGEYIKVSPDYINNHEITLCGSYNNPRTTKAAVELLGSKHIDCSSLITHSFSLTDFGEAFGKFGTEGALKILIKP